MGARDAPELDAARVGRRGELLRLVNERMRELDGVATTDEYEFVCECLDDHCFALLTMVAADFDALRSELGRFVVAPGHERAGVDAVLERRERYTLVTRPAL